MSCTSAPDSSPPLECTRSAPADAAPKQRRARRVGPNSRPGPLATLDRRTKEARLLKRMEAELTRHVGGTPSATQRALIARAAMLTLHVAMLDARALENSGAMTGHDQRAYLAFSNSLSRALRDLGLDAATAAPPSLADIIATPARAAPDGGGGAGRAKSPAGAAEPPAARHGVAA